MPLLALLGVESSTVTVVVDLFLVCCAVLYVALIYWTYADARSRILDSTLVGLAVALSLLPFIGTLVYLLLRPAESVEDAGERELEVEVSKLQLHRLESDLCPHCDYPIEGDFVRCPSCLRTLKEPCRNCSRPLDRAWTICPYCEADVPAAPPRSARRGARRAEAGSRQAGPGEGAPSQRSASKASPASASAASQRPASAGGRDGKRRAQAAPIEQGAAVGTGGRVKAGTRDANARARDAGERPSR